ncbi:MAG: hypothetical protein KY461_11680 [Actinobacteria bacterium]|nr:hypothetical protein [Actinomycetota bacterium]
MTRIRATCPDCGEVDLQPTDIELRIVRGDDGEVGNGSSYRFACPTCTTLVTKPADERIARLLATGGVEISIERQVVSVATVDRAEELRRNHPEEPGSGPAIDYDDLLDLHLALQGEDWFSELTRSVA